MNWSRYRSRHKEFVVEIEQDDKTYEIYCTASPGDPGRTYGPPEKCYPPEPPEVEVVRVTCEGKPAELEISGKLMDKIYDQVLSEAADYYDQDV